MRIAILEDDPAQQQHLITTLRQGLADGSFQEPLECLPYVDGMSLQQALLRERFDLVLLDWGVPRLDGMSLLRWIRARLGHGLPVLMVSSHNNDFEVASALNAGADDYLVKPFGALEMMARIRRLLQRADMAGSRQRREFGRWTLVPAEQMVEYRACPNSSPEHFGLSAREFECAQLLFTHLGQSVSRTQLLEAAGYAPDTVNLTRILDNHIYRLRKKLKLEPARGLSLHTVYGHGFRLELTAEGSA